MPFELSEFFVAPTDREVQLVVDAMPMLFGHRIAEIEKSASAAQIVNQANVQAIRSEFTDSCNKVVDQASAKFAHIELQAQELHETAKAIVDGAGQDFTPSRRSSLRRRKSSLQLRRYLCACRHWRLMPTR